MKAPTTCWRRVQKHPGSHLICSHWLPYVQLSSAAHGVTWSRSCAGTVSAKPIVLRAEYAYCPNLTIIDTPGFILKAGIDSATRHT